MDGTEPDRDRAGSPDPGADPGIGDADVLASDGLPDHPRDDERAAGLDVHSVPVPDAVPALGPGDDDPRSPVVGEAIPATAPLGPGDSTGVNEDDQFDFHAPLAAGPGDASTGARNVVRIAKRT